MYGAASEQSSSGGNAQKERVFTPKGQMAIGANNKPPLMDLPINLKIMFDLTSHLNYKQPPAKKPKQTYTGVGQYTNLFEKTAPPPPTQHFETPYDRKKMMLEQLEKLSKEKNDLMAADWDPHSNQKATGNAYNTLFVGRLSYETTEKKLRREFEQFGNIISIRVVHDLDRKPRGYAFIEFESEQDMMNAYKRGDGRKIDGRRVVLDVERGRTVRNWRPMRLGGGLGGRKSVKSRKQLEEEAYKAKIASGKTDEAPIFGDRGRERTANSRDRGDRNGSDRGDRSATRAPDRTADIYGPGKSDTFDRRAGSRERRPSSRDRRGNSRDRRGGGERERRRSRSRDRRGGPGLGFSERDSRGGGGGRDYYGGGGGSSRR